MTKILSFFTSTIARQASLFEIIYHHRPHIFTNYHTSQTLWKRRKTKEERKSPRIIEYSPKPKQEAVDVWRDMTVSDLAHALNKSVDHVFEVMLYVSNTSHYSAANSRIDSLDVLRDIAKKSGFRTRIISAPSKKASNKVVDRDAYQNPPQTDPNALTARPPVVTIMGHVDHGKTTLLDAYRNTRVVDQEFGGITQHIGAFSVDFKGASRITFLDTPGHAAFSAMRARGANVTDLVVLVVAADDGVMDQTVESIRMAKQADVPIIVAANKMDKPQADLERTIMMLMQNGIQAESKGGDVQVVPISALKRTNLDLLAEAILTQAEILELKADAKGLVEAVVVESKLDPQRGKLSTAIIQRGTLRRGKVLVSGTAWAKVRAMLDHDGNQIEEAPPSTPVEIVGWRDLPSAGDDILEVESERRAHEVVKYRHSKKLQEKQMKDMEVIAVKQEQHQVQYREQLERKRKIGRLRMRSTGPRQKEIPEDDGFPELSVVIKADVDGSIEAILNLLDTYNSYKDCRLDVVHFGVGPVTETDLEFAESFAGLIYAFNVETPPRLQDAAEQRAITIKNHNVIYKLADDIKEEINSRLPLKQVEEVVGEANVLQQFLIDVRRKKVPVAGCRCTKGMLKKTAKFRVLRNGEVVFDGDIASMRHLKEEVSSVKNDTECGLQFAEKALTFEPGDQVVCYELRSVPQTIDWDPGF